MQGGVVVNGGQGSQIATQPFQGEPCQRLPVELLPFLLLFTVTFYNQRSIQSQGELPVFEPKVVPSAEVQEWLWQNLYTPEARSVDQQWWSSHKPAYGRQ